MPGQIIVSICDTEHSKNDVIIADRENLVSDFDYYFSTYNTILDLFVSVFNGIAEEGGHETKLTKKIAIETFRAFTPGIN